MFTKLNSFDEIKDVFYTGYVWYSDKAAPQQLTDGKFSRDEGETGFILEAKLYAKAEKLSVSVKYIGGDYFISEVKLAGCPSELKAKAEYSYETYIANPSLGKKIGEGFGLSFLQYWEKTKDNACEGMEVLKPTWSAFVGFEKIKEEKSS